MRCCDMSLYWHSISPVSTCDQNTVLWVPFSIPNTSFNWWCPESFTMNDVLITVSNCGQGGLPLSFTWEQKMVARVEISFRSEPQLAAVFLAQTGILAVLCCLFRSKIDKSLSRKIVFSRQTYNQSFNPQNSYKYCKTCSILLKASFIMMRGNSYH